MRRRGFLMIEALLALGIMTLVCAGVFPLLGKTAHIAADLSHRIRCRDDGAFGAEYVTEAVRFARARSTNTEITESDSYSFKRKSSKYGIQTYGFSAANGVLRFRVYEGGAQPLVGESESTKAYTVGVGEKNSYFTAYSGGLLRVSFRVNHTDGETFSAETAVLPLCDFLKMGEYFE